MKLRKHHRMLHLPAGLGRLTMAGTIIIYIVIVLGGIVRATGAGLTCAGWPFCEAGWGLPADRLAWIAFSHRVATLLIVPIISVAVIWAMKKFRQERWISLPLLLAGIVLGVQILVGRFIVLQGGQGIETAIHLGLSLILEMLVVVQTVVAFYKSEDVQSVQRQPTVFRTPFARLALVSLAAVFVLLVSGAFVSASGAAEACSSWPLCNNGWIPDTLAGWINMTHRLVVLATGILLAALLFKAWKTQRTQAPILVSTTAGVVLFLAQALLGGLKVASNFPAHLLALHEATAAAVWTVFLVMVVAVGMAARTVEDEDREIAAVSQREHLLKDLLALTKPIVVLLLLVTTYAGMVIGARSWPSLSLTFWTLLGGFMAAGGSGAINQYIDRYDDLKMQRTQKRPIPSGRMTPAEGLAFGVGLTLASFYLVVAMVNLLAALLTLAGIVYYVLLYSILLKKTTVQNIVIGGGAGAIPPLVGWAAATGSLNVPSLFLFAVVFMWTPPHFWALALVRRKDYARAGVPMLPVIRGEKETRWQILLYTIELVGLTLLLPLFGLGGSVYFVSALALGAFLLQAAWKVWKQEGNKVAWKMYRYSSMYLAFIFVALMVDALL
jgi:protoheme IX farnesyltransferase